MSTSLIWPLILISVIGSIQFMYWTFCQLLPVFPLSRQKQFLPWQKPNPEKNAVKLALTAAWCWLNVYTGVLDERYVPGSAGQMLSKLSFPPLARYLPSGDHFKPQTSCWCAGNEPTRCCATLTSWWWMKPLREPLQPHHSETNVHATHTVTNRYVCHGTHSSEHWCLVTESSPSSSNKHRTVPGNHTWIKCTNSTRGSQRVMHVQSWNAFSSAAARPTAANTQVIYTWTAGWRHVEATLSNTELVRKVNGPDWTIHVCGICTLHRYGITATASDLCW